MTCKADMTKIEKYKTLFEQIKAVVEDEDDLIANMANIAAMLHKTFGFWWTAFNTFDDTDKEWMERIVSLL